MNTFWLCYGEYKGKRSVQLFTEYLKARLKRQTKEMWFEVFVTDSLKNINDSIAETFGGAIMKERYVDFIKPKPVETRTAEEIISDISNKLNNIGAE